MTTTIEDLREGFEALAQSVLDEIAVLKAENAVLRAQRDELRTLTRELLKERFTESPSPPLPEPVSPSPVVVIKEPKKVSVRPCGKCGKDFEGTGKQRTCRTCVRQTAAANAEKARAVRMAKRAAVYGVQDSGEV